jgi:peptide/nickel transport system ATP-binding protein
MEENEYALTSCKFAPRCPYASEACRRTRPYMVVSAEGRKVLCFHPLGDTVSQVP